MSGRLSGKIAIVAGAGSSAGAGIGNGKASAVVYARQGASILVVDLNGEAAKETRKMIEGEGGRCDVFQADISRKSDCQAMVEKCLSSFGRVDILHNNVGIESRSSGILDTDEVEWNRLMDINLKSMFLTSQAVLPSMLERGKGAIINISSISADSFSPGGFLYSVSKAGVNALTRALSIDFADKGIRVNAIMPGFMDTPMVGPKMEGILGQQAREARNARVPMKRMGESWDVANAALFLVSDEAQYITGQVLAVEGGVLNKLP